MGFLLLLCIHIHLAATQVHGPRNASAGTGAAGFREGYEGAIGGLRGFPYWGGAGPGQPFADGGVSRGMGNGFGSGSLRMFLERRRTGTEDEFPEFFTTDSTGLSGGGGMGTNLFGGRSASMGSGSSFTGPVSSFNGGGAQYPASGVTGFSGEMPINSVTGTDGRSNLFSGSAGMSGMRTEYTLPGMDLFGRGLVPSTGTISPMYSGDMGSASRGLHAPLSSSVAQAGFTPHAGSYTGLFGGSTGLGFSMLPSGGAGHSRGLQTFGGGPAMPLGAPTYFMGHSQARRGFPSSGMGFSADMGARQTLPVGGIGGFGYVSR